MFGINKNGTKHKVGIAMPSFFPSRRVTYDNTQSGLTSTDVQGAIDELAQGGGGSYTAGDGIDITNDEISVDTAFTEASTRTNIASGDSLATIWGKIKKFFSDLKTVAFTGSYTDLSNQPTIPTNNNQLTNGAGYITSSGSCASATKATQDADGYDIRKRYVNVYNSADVGTSSAVTVNDLANQGSAVGMIYAATDNPEGVSKWVHVWSQAWTKGANNAWVSQLALGVASGTGMWYRTNQGTAVGRGWKRVIDSDNLDSSVTNAGFIKNGKNNITSYTVPGTAASSHLFVFSGFSAYGSFDILIHTRYAMGVIHVESDASANLFPSLGTMLYGSSSSLGISVSTTQRDRFWLEHGSWCGFNMLIFHPDHGGLILTIS